MLSVSASIVTLIVDEVLEVGDTDRRNSSKRTLGLLSTRVSTQNYLGKAGDISDNVFSGQLDAPDRATRALYTTYMDNSI